MSKANEDLILMRDALARNYSPDYVLRQMAEEYAEAAQAALKLIRALNGETPVTPSEAMRKLIEEVADCDLMRDIFFCCTNPECIEGYIGTRNFKTARTWERLKERCTDEK